MNLFEFFSSKKDFSKSYQNTEHDQSQLKFSDSRKTRLTLRQIQQLRKMNDVRDIEKKNEVDRLKEIYGARGE
jgi:cell shape-determining protein MreC